jgi:large subunit ribosomal protein L15
MPIQRRLPKTGFTSRTGRKVDQVTLFEIGLLTSEVVDLKALQDAGFVNKSILRAKIILSGELSKSVCIKGLLVTKGARKIIEDLGGRIED